MTNEQNNNQRVLNILGLATRARKTSFGYDVVAQTLLAQKAYYVFVASDASDSTKEKFINKCFYYKVPINTDFNAVELSKAVGKNNSKIIAVNDQGFSENLKKLLKEGVKYES